MHLTALLGVVKPKRPSAERAPDIVFDPSRIGLPLAVAADNEPRLMVVPPPAHTERRASRFEYASSELAALNLDLAPMSMVSITGSERNSYAVSLHAEVNCSDARQARALLDRLSFARKGEILVLRNPPSLPGIECRSRLDILTPADAAVVVTGAYSAVQCFGIKAPVTISTTHGKTSFFDVGGRIDAMANDGGSIVFVGSGGCARLHADLGIDLKLTNATFKGTLEAVANGDVRLLVPRGFATGIQAHVASDVRFVCRSKTLPRFRRQKEGGKTVSFRHADRELQLHLVSRHGAVIIDEMG